MSRSRGHYTNKHAQRCCKLAGGLGKQLDTLYSRRIAETYVHRSHGKRKDIKQQVAEFVEEYQPDSLFKNSPGRQHPTFPSFSTKWTIDLDDLKQRIHVNNAVLDMYLRVAVR